MVSSANDQGSELPSSTAGARLNEGHYIEVLHAAWMVQEMIQKFLIDHPVVGQNEYLSQLADKAFDGVYDLYQTIAEFGGTEHYAPAKPVDHLEGTKVADETK